MNDELRQLVDDVVTRCTPDALWSTLHELGLTTIGLPEEAGGSGGTLADLSVVVESLAAHGCQTPIVEHTTVDWMLHSAGLPLVHTGTLVEVPVTGERTDLVLPAVPWATRSAQLVLLPPEGTPPSIVELRAPGVTIGDETDVAGAPLNRVELTGARQRSMPGAPGIRETRSRLAMLRAAAILGAARAAYQLTRDHVRTRTQFGRALIALPAVRTALARIRVEIIQAEAAVRNARTVAGTERGYHAAVAARVTGSAVAGEVARLAHQLHGAIGITEEYALHRLSRTLWALRDADLAEDRWPELLATAVIDRGEDALWQLTAVAC